MKKTLFAASILVGLIMLLASGQAFAGKDVIYPSAVNATVDSANAGTSNNFAIGTEGSTTLDEAVFVGEAVSLTVTWSIQDNSKDSGTSTDYANPRTVIFTASTTVSPESSVIVTLDGIPSCTVSSNASTCTTSIAFIAPSTVGNYQVDIEAKDPVTGQGSNVRIEGTIFRINFSVAAAAEGKSDTILTVKPECFLLNQGYVNLTATLKELSISNVIQGAAIDFYINPELDGNGVPTVASIGTESTDTDGVASLTYNVNGLGVGDHNLYAEFNGDASYNPSNDSDILGISYMFVGFRQPINADGTSIFGGRVIPIKIKLVDANGTPVTDAAPTVWLTSYGNDLGLGEEREQVSSVSAADTDNIMRYDPNEMQYIYNWDATDLINGTYAVVVDLGDSPRCRAENPYSIITVAKKGKK